jgi:uncharacterized protein (TIGR02145 family)
MNNMRKLNPKSPYQIKLGNHDCWCVKIGTQVWMTENLKVTNYRNGDAIPNVTNDILWKNHTTGALSWYNNDPTVYKTIYGALYNWYAVSDIRCLAPAGWHIPTDTEWTILTDFLGGESKAGGKMKEKGTAHWLSPNTGADNSSGFSALPGGFRDYSGPFVCIGLNGFWWSATEFNTESARIRSLYNTSAVACRESDFLPAMGYKLFGYSVRCVLD